MGALAQQVDGRLVYVCPICRMHQFLIKNKRCRRCGANMLPAPVLVPDAPAPVPPPKGIEAQLAIFAKRIVLYRMGAGLTQRELSERLAVGEGTSGKSHSWISRIETGTHRPSIRMLERFADALHVTVPDLFEPFSDNWFYDEMRKTISGLSNMRLQQLHVFMHDLEHDRYKALAFAAKVGLPVKQARDSG